MASTPRPLKRAKVPTLPHDDEEDELHVQFAQPEQLQLSAPDPAAAAAAVAHPASEELSPEEEERHKIWDIFSEEYHDIVTELPLEFQRNFHLIRELEDSQQSSTQHLQALLLSYVSSLATPASAHPPTGASESDPAAPNEQGPNDFAREQLASISKTARAAIRAGEDKVGLAVTLYESVDRHIRRLDASLLQHEDSLLMGLREGTLPSHDAPSAADKDPPSPTTSRGAIALGEKAAYTGGVPPATSSGKKETKSAQREKDKKRKKEDKKRKREGLPPLPKSPPKKGGQQLPLVEMLSIPIDPTEPTYCYCRRVSFGTMIGCENEDCPREWFHMECLNLTTPPLGTWYCRDCAVALGIDEEDSEKGTKGKKKN